MKTDGGWINVSECARLYSKDRKWVYDQIKRYEIETRKENNRKILRLVDLIAHRGEPPNGAPAHTETHTEESQKIAPALTPPVDNPTGETDLLKQENQFLKEKIGELEADRSERQAREARWEEERMRLEGIIERQTYALPQSTEERGVLSRFMQWLTLK